MSGERSLIQVIGVMSSARLDGNTAGLVRAALQGAMEAGAQTTEMALPQYRIEFCRGCFTCMAQGRCAMDDDFEELRRRLTEADGVILSSPTYGAAPSARMKNLIDRMGLFEYFTSSAFGGKYLVGISTANSADTAKKVARNLANQFAGGVFERGYVSGTLGASSRGGSVPEAARQQAHQLGIRLVRDIQSGQRYPLQALSGTLLNRFILKPNFARVIVDNRDGFMKGVYLNLRQRDLLQGTAMQPQPNR